MYQGVARKSEFTGNSVAFDGGALFYGAADSCTFGGNFAGEAGGGAYECELRNCSFSGNSSGSHGGGVFGGTLHNGTLMGNSAVYGGGAVGGEFYNCLFIGNSATTRGGGTAESTLYNCTLTGNSATIEAGGTYGGTLFNCIVFYNSASYGPNHGQAAIHYSCTTPLPFYGAGNIINEPVFADPAADDYRLRAGSPGIDAGTNLTALLTSDLDGNARPLDGDGDSVATFDMGAYEFRLEENHSGSHKGGVFHFVVKKKMATTGMLADARGYVVSQQNQLNNAGNQSLSISMSGLEPGTPYQLWARRGDDTYPILITDFISSTSGFASLQYRRNRLNHRPGLRRGGNSLPEFLGPLRNLRELFIADSNLETVLVADLTSPDQLLLRFKAGLSNDGVDANASGSVNIAGSMRKAEIQLFARRLDPGATYHPTINGDATAPLFADPKGKLRFTTRLESPVDLLDVRTVGIRNTSNQDVLSIRLPY
jgi:hypothetical protein